MRLLLIALIAFLTLSSVFAWDPGPAPGVKVKNALLYLLTLGLMLRVALSSELKVKLAPIETAFGVLILYAIGSFVIVVGVVEYPRYNVIDNALLLKNLVDQLLLFIVFFYGLRTPRDALQMLKFLLFAFALSHAMAVLDALDIVSFGDIERRKDGRVQGLIGESNQYGAFVAMTLPGVIAMCLITRGVERVVWLVASLITAITLVMTVSRGAFVATLVAGACAFIMFRRYAPPGRLALLAIASVAGIVLMTSLAAALGFGDLIEERLNTTGRMSEVSSGRTDIWSNALVTMFEQPLTLLTGYGWRSYWSMPFRYSPHNHYLNNWFNLGLVGLFCSIFLFAWPIRKAKQAIANADHSARPVLMGFVAGAIALAVAVFFVDLSSPWLYFWAYVGCVMRIAIEVESTSMPHSSPVLEDEAVAMGAGDAFGWKGRAADSAGTFSASR
jgi:O-antigen ligase